MNSYCISSKSNTRETHFAGAVKQLNFNTLAAAAVRWKKWNNLFTLSYSGVFFCQYFFNNFDIVYFFATGLTWIHLCFYGSFSSLCPACTCFCNFKQFCLTRRLVCFYNAVWHTVHLLYKLLPLLTNSLHFPLKSAFYFNLIYSTYI